ncbi:MAG: PfkB family carbohydrate kinase [Archaeoglobaceae archaeon]
MISAHAPALVDYVFIVDKFPALGGHAKIVTTAKFPGGAGANVVHNLATLGVDATLFTTLGKDEDAKFFIENTKAEVSAEITSSQEKCSFSWIKKERERFLFNRTQQKNHLLKLSMASSYT